MKLRRLLPVLMGIALLFVFTAMADARAGGGEGYNGGGGGGHGNGGGSYGGGGGHGGGGGFVIDLILFCITHPAIGVPLIIVVGMVIYFQQTGSSASVQQDDATTIPLSPRGDAIAGVRSHDPAFDPDAFCQRVGNGFLKLQSAWCAQELKYVRPFISDGIHERFLLQFAEQKAEGYRDQMDGVAICRLVIADGNSDEIYDQLAVQIHAQAADYRVAMRDGRPLHGIAPQEEFVEIWSFLRRRGSATTPGKPGLLEGQCPNCGAPIELNESANCTNCNALLRSGQYDWVLSEVSQGSEWQYGGHGQTPGLTSLRQRDPDLNVQSLEDRVSVIFWRKTSADRIGKLDPLFKVATPAYGQIYATRLKAPAGAARTYFGQCAVGAVNVLGFVIGGDQDLALIEIRWSGVKLAVQADATVQVIEGNSPHHTLFVLMRKASAKTDAAKGISSAHCPNCGAPETGGTGGACEFCGTALNDGSNGWVLDNILSFSDPAAQTLLHQMHNGG